MWLKLSNAKSGELHVVLEHSSLSLEPPAAPSRMFIHVLLHEIRWPTENHDPTSALAAAPSAGSAFAKHDSVLQKQSDPKVTTRAAVYAVVSVAGESQTSWPIQLIPDDDGDFPTAFAFKQSFDFIVAECCSFCRSDARC